MFYQPTNVFKRITLQQAVLFVVSAIALFGIGGSYFFYSKYRAIKANPNIEVQKETASILAMVGGLMELPKNETPTIATISDKTKLNNQPFFQMAENGDILLAYTTAMKAILYRPGTDKIINVAPLTINQAQDQAQGTKPGSIAPAPLRIAYYNGTATVGLSGTTEKLVKASYPTWQTTTLTNASKTDYTSTLVIDLSGAHANEARMVAALLKGRVESLPKGEAKPDADLLIISGK